MGKEVKGIGPRRRSVLETSRKFAETVSEACAVRRKEIGEIDEDMEALQYAYLHVSYECENMLRGVAPYRKPDLHKMPLPPHWVLLKYDTAICSSCGSDMDTGFYTTKEAEEHWHELYGIWRFCPRCGKPMIDPDGFQTEEDECHGKSESAARA